MKSLTSKNNVIYNFVINFILSLLLSIDYKTFEVHIQPFIGAPCLCDVTLT